MHAPPCYHPATPSCPFTPVSSVAILPPPHSPPGPGGGLPCGSSRGCDPAGGSRQQWHREGEGCGSEVRAGAGVSGKGRVGRWPLRIRREMRPNSITVTTGCADWVEDGSLLPHLIYSALLPPPSKLPRGSRVCDPARMSCTLFRPSPSYLPYPPPHLSGRLIVWPSMGCCAHRPSRRCCTIPSTVSGWVGQRGDEGRRE